MSDNNMKKEKVIQIPIEWDWDSEIITQYVNHMRVTHVGTEFYLYFGELPFPGILPDEGLPEKLTIKTKVRLVVTGEQMGKFIDALNENYNNYLQKKETDQK